MRPSSRLTPPIPKSGGTANSLTASCWTRHAARPESFAAILTLNGAKPPEQLHALQTTQIELLTALWPLLKPGGRLLYSTCSLLRGENDGVIESFLDDHPSAEPDTISAKWGIATEHGRQLLPGLDDTDGFYYAVLTHRYNSGVRPRN